MRWVADRNPRRTHNETSPSPEFFYTYGAEEDAQERFFPPAETVSVEVLISAGFDADAATEFIAHKNRAKAPLTARAWADHCREADKAGWTAEQAAEKVMARGWKGFEAKYVADEVRGGSASQALSFRERDALAAAARVAEFSPRAAAKPSRSSAPTEIFDVTPRVLG